MAWLANNWIWILVGSAFIAFHLFVHGKHVAADLTVVEGNHRLHADSGIIALSIPG